MDSLKKLIREIPDFPKPGILFYDITTLLGDKDGFHELVDKLCEHYNGRQVDKVAGIEARGFIFGPALAYRLRPASFPSASRTSCRGSGRGHYELKYGTEKPRCNEDAVKPGERILICDDLLATGGTAAAATKLVRQQRGEVVGAAFAVELNFLHGRAKLPGVDVFLPMQYDK